MPILFLEQTWPWSSRPETRQLQNPIGHRFKDREKSDIGRLYTLAKFAELPECLPRFLSNYFDGKTLLSCGHCSHCLDDSRKSLSRNVLRVSDEGLASMGGVISRQELAHPRQMARFLCGMSSPASSKSRLTRDPIYGSMSHIPFMEVLKKCEDTMSYKDI